jgi:hypothetical protein
MFSLRRQLRSFWRAEKEFWRELVVEGGNLGLFVGGIPLHVHLNKP